MGSLTPLKAGFEYISLKHYAAYLIPKSFFDILRALKNSPRLVKRLLDENVENDLRLWPTMSMFDENSTNEKRHLDWINWTDIWYLENEKTSMFDF